MSEAITNPIWVIVATDPADPLPDAPWRERVLFWCLRRFLAPGYRHCFAMRRSHLADAWIVVDSKAMCLDVIETPGSSYSHVIDLAVAEGRAAALIVRPDRPDYWQPRLLFSCVSVVSHLTGVRVPFWAGPKRLLLEARKQLEVIEMGGPDTSAADAARKQADKDRAELKRENDARRSNIRSRQGGRRQFSFLSASNDGFGGNV